MRTLSRLLPLSLSGCSFLLPLPAEKQKALDSHRYNAQYWYEHGDLGRARQQALAGLRIDPDDGPLLLLMGWASLRRDTREDVYAAEEYFDQVVGGGLFRKADYRALLGLGLTLRRQGDLLRAAADRVEKGELRPDRSKDPAKETARLRSLAGKKYGEAVARLEKTLRLNPDNPLALDNLQQLHALRGETARSLEYGGRFASLARASREFYRRQLERPDLAPDDEKTARERLAENVRREVESRGLSANLLFKESRFSEALAELDALLALDPERPGEYFNRAGCRRSLGDHAGAIGDLEEFLRRTKLPFDSPQVLQAYDLLREWGQGEEGAKARRPS